MAKLFWTAVCCAAVAFLTVTWLGAMLLTSHEAQIAAGFVEDDR